MPGTTSKISGFAAFSDVVVTDILVGVDVSDTSMASTGTTKKITVGQLLTAFGANSPQITSPFYLKSLTAPQIGALDFPLGGGYLYVENGALKYKGPSSITTLANA